MKIRIFLLLYFLACIIIININLFAEEKIITAVFDFEAKNLSQENADAVTELFRTELFNTGRFHVVERTKINEIINEQKFQLSGLTNTNSVVEIGKICNAQKVILGTYTKIGDSFFINTRLVDVQSGLVVIAETIESKEGENEIQKYIRQLAYTVANKIRHEGSVIKIEKESVIIDLGKNSGIEVDNKFEVIRSGDVVKDKKGIVIGRKTDVIGSIKVKETQENFSSAIIEEKKKEIIIGDKVRPFYFQMPFVADFTQVKGMKKPGLGILISAAIPGTGEMYAGSWIKGGIILGAEVALWMGYAKFWNDGKDLTVEYEAYADQYWSKEEYERNIQTGDPSTHTLPETKTQQYYEMIGKYHQFKRGWYDWEETGPDMTPMRTDYMDMREDSNIAFRKAFYFSMVSLANHVFSAFDAAWTIRNVNRKIETGVRMGMNRFDQAWIPHCTVSVAW